MRNRGCHRAVTRTFAAACSLAVVVPGTDDVVDESLTVDETSAEDATPDEATNDDELCELAAVDDAVGAAPVVEVDVVPGVGAQVDAGSALPRGGGSFGFPPPCDWKRHPSTTSLCTREPPGPTLEYSHEPPRPCQYDQ